MHHEPIQDQGGRNPAEPAQVPPEFIELPELTAVSIDHKLGYHGDAPVVVFGYSSGAQEVFWKDGRSSGFGLGHWRFLLDKIGPIAERHGAVLARGMSAGTHVLVLDRRRRRAYATCRSCAERFLAEFYALPVPTRECLCGSEKHAQPHPT